VRIKGTVSIPPSLQKVVGEITVSISRNFVRKGEVDWDMVEALRLIYTGGPDHLIMIDDVQLEKS